MKYTKLLINGNFFNSNVLYTNNPYLKPMSTLVTIIIVFVGIAGITTIFPLAIVADSYRSTKYQILMLNKNYLHIHIKKTNYFDFLSRDIPNIKIK